MVLPWPVEPMLARTVAAIPDGDGWSYEPKFDGFRCLVHVADDGRVRLQSRQQRSLTRAFPDLVQALAEQLPAGTVLDGELVVLVEGRVSFEALQRRLAARRGSSTPAASLVAFDLLAYAGEDLRTLSYAERRRRLREAASATALAVVPATTDATDAAGWLRQGERGVEGVVAKRLDHAYLPRRRYWSKVRAKETTEAIVGGVTGPLAAPTGLVLGRHDERGQLRVIGRTRPLRPDASRALAEALTQPRAPHPWPPVLAGGRFGLAGGDAVEYTQVEPATVVEVEVDTAFELGRYRHGVQFIRTRLDLQPGDVRVTDRGAGAQR